MNYKLEGSDILYNDQQLGPYPDHLLKRVDRITTEFVYEPGPRDPKDNAGERVKNGSLGPKIAELLNNKNKAPKSADGRPVALTEKPDPLAACLTEVRAHARTIRDIPNPVAPEKAPIPDDPRVISRHIKAFGYFLGADAVGICEIPPYACYTVGDNGKRFDCKEYKYAIVLVKHKHWETCEASTGRDRVFDACSHQCYQALGQWSETMANYIRRLGWPALASNSGNYVTVMTALILAAGLGESGRLGIAVNPFMGPNIKSAAILTNLPMEPDKPIDFGLRDYCDKCQLCCDACTAGTFPKTNEKEEYHGYITWKKDYERCVLFGATNKNGSSCGRCTIMCPWNNPKNTPEAMKEWDGSIEWLHARADERAEYLRSRNFKTEASETQRWWFDLVKEDGKYIIPRTAKYEILPDLEPDEQDT